MSASNYATTGSQLLPPVDGSPPYSNINATGEYVPNWGEDRHVVDIENVRGSVDQYKLDNAGFQFGRQASNHTSFSDDREVEAEYSREYIELIKKLTWRKHCRYLLITQSHRHRPEEADDSPQKRQARIQLHPLPVSTATFRLPMRRALLKRRFQIINLWRPISHAALDWPLVLCDFQER